MNIPNCSRLAGVFFVLIFCVHISHAQEKTSTSEGIIWGYAVQNVQWNNRWNTTFSAQYRSFLEREDGFHVFLSGGVGYKLSHGFSVGGGFTNLNINGRFDDNELFLSELRPYQFLQLNYPAGRLRFNWRMMVEERFLRFAANGEKLPGYEYVWRFRNRALFMFTLTELLRLEASSEVMIHAGTSVIVNDFDQHRAILQFHYSLGQFQISSGYMHWFVQTFGGVLENRHTWLIGLRHNLDRTK